MNGPSRRVQLISRGKGHTESDLILYLPDDGVLFTGDLVFNGAHPYLAHGFLEEWKAYLQYLETLEVQNVIPGHGALGDKEIVRGMHQYILTLENLAANMLAEGSTEEEAGQATIPTQYEEWMFGRFFVPNMQFLYRVATEKNKSDEGF